MKNVILSLLLATAINTVSAQSYTAKISNSLGSSETITPGEIKTMKVTITNTSSSGFVYGKSDFNLVLEYTGNQSVGRAFNQTIKLPKTLPAGESYTFNGISFKAPILPGEYPVNVSFYWGNRRVTNGGTITFTIEEKYEASLSVSKLVVEDNRSNNISVRVTNTGGTAWPESNFSLKFELMKAPSAATSADRARFNMKSGIAMKWDFEPGESDDFEWRGFLTPQTVGKYVVKIILLRSGEPFDAEGAEKEVTFEVR